MTTDETDERMWSIRLRKRLGEWSALVVVALVVLGLFGGWVAYQTHLNPGTETTEVTESTWNEEVSVSHAATVTEPNPVFAEGQTLSDQSVYFVQLASKLNSTVEYTYSASDTGRLDVVTDATLRMQSVGSEENVLWSVTEPLAGDSVEGLSPDEQTTTTATLNVSALLAELERIQSGLGATVGTTEALIVFDIQATGEVNGETVTRTQQQTVTVDAGTGTYSVETDEAVSQTYESTDTLTAEATYGPLRVYGSVALVVVAVAGLVGLAAARYRGVIPPSPAERAMLTRHRERQEFDDWISTGTVPTEARTGAAIRLDSLEDLVDVAIDTNERVIEDTETGDFFVVDTDQYYTYSGDWLIDDPDLDRLPVPGATTDQPDGDSSAIFDTPQAEGTPDDGTQTDGGTEADSHPDADDGDELESEDAESEDTDD
jgi:hypothetical protein